jgi:hypothetical protein
MRKPKEQAKPTTVSVRLLCILSGDKQSWSAGEIVEVDAQEAARLVEQGAAEMLSE